MPDINEHLVSELRGRFLCQSSTHSEEFEEKDIEKIRSNDEILHRFLVAKGGNVEEALKQLIAAMKWRKSYGIYRLNEESFPREFFQMGCIFSYGQDLNGAQTIVFRIKANKKIGEWTELVKKYIAFLIEKEYSRYEKGDNKGICIVFDCNGAGVTNVDIDLLLFIVSTLRDYYPYILKSVVVNQLPWVLKYVFKLVQSWLPKEQQQLLHLVSQDELGQYIAADQLPDFMGGTNDTPYKICPKTALPAEELAKKMGIKQKELEKLLNHLEPYLNSTVQ